MKRLTKPQYVARLRQMLKRTDTCNCCPACKGFKVAPRHRRRAKDYADNLAYVCLWCRAFVGLSIGADCPCTALGSKQRALHEAHRALAEWDAGTHKWQKEGK
jgi:hypothetical protein